MQQDLDLYHDWLASINATGDFLRDKVPSGAIGISPITNDVNEEFSSLQQQLKTKHEE